MKQLISPKGLYHLLLETLLGSLGVLGSVLCLSTAFSIPFPAAAWFLVPAMILLLGIPAKMERGMIWYAIVGGILLLAGLLLHKGILRSFRELWTLLLQQYAKGYDRLRDFVNPQAQPDRAAAGRALLVIALAEAYGVTPAVCRWKRTGPGAAILLLGVAPCFVLVDTMPSLWALLMVAVSVLVQIFSQNVRRREPRETGKAVLWSALISGLALIALVLIFPKRTYKPPLTWRDLTDWVEDWSAQQNNRGNELAGLSGNPAAVHLQQLRSLPNQPMEVLELTTDYSGRIYLRGSAYNIYDGYSWSRDTRIDWSEKTVFPSLGSSAAQVYTADISPIHGDDLFFTIYEPLTLPANAELQGDAYLRNRSPKASYSLQFSPDAAGAAQSQDYTDYVRLNCLQLDPETAEALRGWFVDHAGAGSLNLPTAAKAELVSDLISQTAPYSREASYPPAGKDFACWFLEDAETGYCVHYATTAAAMLRSLGIPSRYVSGYICTPDANGYAKVTTLQAHAWVEYYDGGSWHRLEPTPGNATEFTGRLPTQEIPSEQTSQTETETPTFQITTEAPTEPPTETVPAPVTEPAVSTEAPEPSHRPDTPETAETGGADSPETSEAAPDTRAPAKPWKFPAWLWIPIGLLGLLGLILLRRRLARTLRERKLRSCDVNTRAVLIFRRYRKLCGLLGAEPDAQALELAKKAGFSQHELDREEQRYLTQTLDQTISRLDRSGFWKRLWYRYGLAVI